MPPKPKFTKEEILAAALELARERGLDGVSARDVGARLGTSAKVVYGAYSGMEELKQAVVDGAEERFLQFCRREVDSGAYPPYKCIGMGYIRFAREEPELYRMLFMCDRTGERPRDLGFWETAHVLQRQTGMEDDAAARFHTEMWIFVHGIATTMVTSFQQWDMEQVSQMLTDVYTGLKKGI